MLLCQVSELVPVLFANLRLIFLNLFCKMLRNPRPGALPSSPISRCRQLVSGAESLQLVADLLKSIDSISEVPEDGQ